MELEPLITNERAQREWEYIVARVGEEHARAAIAQIPGKRRPYPLNIARVLGIELPKRLAEEPASRESALQHLAKIREILSRKSAIEQRT